MTRRRFIRTMLLIGLPAVFVFLWLSDSSEVAQPPVPAATMAAAGPEDRPAAPEKSAYIKVALAADPAEFEAFGEVNRWFHLTHPAFRAELVRLEPVSAAANGYSDALRSADVLLMPGESVLAFAVQGLLLPVDDLLVGDAAAQPFEAVMAGVRWNGLVWGVPYDMDPHVLLWNLELLDALTETLSDSGGEEAAVPEAGGPDGGVRRQAVRVDWEAWQRLPEAMERMEGGNARHFLALDAADPGAWLAWFGAATGLAADLPLGEANETEEVRQALEWLARWGGLVLEASGEDVLAAVRDGRAAAAVVPHSAALRAAEDDGGGLLAVDYSGWAAPFAWPRARSFVILSGTAHEEAARSWIAEATAPDRQLTHHAGTGRLPVSRALLQANPPAHAGLERAPAGAFPHVASPEYGPHLPQRLRELAEGWRKVAAGEWSPDDWLALTR
ncbi:MAG TPA: extracellular solute-binding protein [Paenibacillaceae bacterium]